MFQGPVEPVIEWTADDVPEILYWEGVESTRSATGDERVRRLEDEIRELMIQRNPSPASFSPMSPGAEMTLRELKERLRLLDPNSPWA